MGQMGDEYDTQGQDENCRDAQLAKEPWVKKTSRFDELPEDFSILNESGNVRVFASPDQSLVGIQFPRHPACGPGHDDILFREGFYFEEETDYPGAAARDIWIRPVQHFLMGQRCGEEYQGRSYIGPKRDCDPQLAAERQAIFGDGKQANIADAMVLAQRLRELERGRGR